jgi:flagellar hook assembly protein FlgD
LELYNLLGQRVTTFPLANASSKGQVSFAWNGKDGSGNSVSAGTYFLTLSTPQKRVTVRLVKLD